MTHEINWRLASGNHYGIKIADETVWFGKVENSAKTMVLNQKHLYDRVLCLLMVNATDVNQFYRDPTVMKSLYELSKKPAPYDLSLEKKNDEILELTGFSRYEEFVDLFFTTKNGHDCFFRVFLDGEMIGFHEIENYNLVSRHFFMGYKFQLDSKYTKNGELLNNLTTSNGIMNRSIFQFRPEKLDLNYLHFVILVWKPTLIGNSYYYEIFGHYRIFYGIEELEGDVFNQWFYKLCNFKEKFHEQENMWYQSVLCSTDEDQWDSLDTKDIIIGEPKIISVPKTAPKPSLKRARGVRRV